MRNTETYNTLQKPEILFPTMKPLEKNDGANTKSEGENQAVVMCPQIAHALIFQR